MEGGIVSLELGHDSKSAPQRVSLLSSLRRMKRQAEQSAISVQANARASLFKKSSKVPTKFTGIGESREYDEIDMEDSRLHLRYQELVKDIDIAFRGKEAPITPLSANDSITGIVGPVADMEVRIHYAVSLPQRASKICVHVTRVSGPMPQMYASTATDRPSSDNFDFEAEDGELTYNHEPEDSDELVVDPSSHPSSSSEKQASKRKKALLYVCVECAGDVCEFRLRCSIRRAQPHSSQFTPAEGMAEQGEIRLPRSNLVQRLAQLQCDTHARQQFDEHLVALKVKRQEGWRQNFKAINMRASSNQSNPEDKEAKIQERREQRIQRAQLAACRLEAKEADMEQRAKWWVGRGEERKRQRMEEEKRQEEEHRLASLRSSWLEKLIVLGYARKLCCESLVAKKKHEQFVRELNASITIQRFSIAKLAQWRRKCLYRNLIRCRMAMFAYVRHCRHGVAAVAEAPVQWFLESLVHRTVENVDMLTLIKRFVRRVTVVQRAFRRLSLMRSARADAMLRFFLASELIDEAEMPLSVRPDLQSEATQAQTHDTKQRRKTFQKRSSTGRSESKRLENVEKGLRDSADCSGQPAYIRDYKGEELLPLAVRKYVLYQHVTEMQQTLSSRQHKWNQERIENQIEEDLHRMGLTNEEHPRLMEQRPHVFELNRLRPLYAETYNAYIRGDFRSLLHDLRRRMRKTFAAWRRVVQHISPISDALTMVKDMAKENMSAAQARPRQGQRKTMIGQSMTGQRKPIESIKRTMTAAFDL